ncbi:hypothetical protein D3C72_1623400 [compost metagenome]
MPREPMARRAPGGKTDNHQGGDQVGQQRRQHGRLREVLPELLHVRRGAQQGIGLDQRGVRQPQQDGGNGNAPGEGVGGAG